MTTRSAKRARADTDELYPIRVVCSLTGVNPVTLRAWERRYGLIEPVRTASGHRMYTQEHIDRVRQVLSLLDKGISIGHASRRLARAPSSKSANDQWSAQRERMITAITRFDEEALDGIYNEALGLYPLQVVTNLLLVPLLDELGRRWQSSDGSVAEEHFFSMYLRNKLGARFHHRTRLTTGPKLLCACVPGESHEFGLLLFALAAHEAGLRCVLLGANTPLSELPLACRSAQCDAIVISGSTVSPEDLLREQLPALLLAAGRPVFVGGPIAAQHREAITRLGAIPLGVNIARGVRRLAAEFLDNQVQK
jgi:MerR family transcriptional regulator, light-induced transcriptional regulator